MSSNPSRGWWYGASTEQRLAQVDAGIELGMTAAQVAMNCGCLLTQSYGGGNRLGSGAVVHAFAIRHGRSFAHSALANCRLNERVMHKGRFISAKQARIEIAKDDYFSGVNVDFWSAA